MTRQHVFVQNDGVFRFDPQAADRRRGAEIRELLGGVERVLASAGLDLARLEPASEPLLSGDALILADHGRPRLIYSWTGADFCLRLSSPARARWIDPRAGRAPDASFEVVAGAALITKPDPSDWLLLLSPSGEISAQP
jgi:hypothetical protein